MDSVASRPDSSPLNEKLDHSRINEPPTTLHIMSNAHNMTDFHPIPHEGPSPRDLKVKPTNDPYADQDARWKLIQDHILSTLDGEPMDPSRHMAAFTAVFDLEMINLEGVRLAIYDEKRKTMRHGLRIRLIKLLLAYRETHRSTERLSDEEFIKRWKQVASAITYHDRHFVKRIRDEKAKYYVEDEVFPDDGRTTAFELGRRVWFDEREIKPDPESEETF
jgi:hypothetical protein